MTPSTPRPIRLLLMRHGQTHGNVSGALDTAMPGLDLTDLGRAQARAAARALAEREREIEQVYVSKLVRTHQTAGPYAESRTLAPVELPGIHEITAGQFEMATDKDSVLGYLQTVKSWVTGSLEVRMPGGESGHEFLDRYDSDIATMAAGGARTMLLVSHGAAIRTWVSARAADALHHPQALQPLHNTAVITLEGHPSSGWRLVDWHATPIGGSFLEAEQAPDPTAG